MASKLILILVKWRNNNNHNNPLDSHSNSLKIHPELRNSGIQTYFTLFWLTALSLPLTNSSLISFHLIPSENEMVRNEGSPIALEGEGEKVQFLILCIDTCIWKIVKMRFCSYVWTSNSEEEEEEEDGEWLEYIKFHLPINFEGEFKKQSSFFQSLIPIPLFNILLSSDFTLISNSYSLSPSFFHVLNGMRKINSSIRSVHIILLIENRWKEEEIVSCALHLIFLFQTLFEKQ